MRTSGAQSKDTFRMPTEMSKDILPQFPFIEYRGGPHAIAVVGTTHMITLLQMASGMVCEWSLAACSLQFIQDPF